MNDRLSFSCLDRCLPCAKAFVLFTLVAIELGASAITLAESSCVAVLVALDQLRPFICRRVEGLVDFISISREPERAAPYQDHMSSPSCTHGTARGVSVNLRDTYIVSRIWTFPMMAIAIQATQQEDRMLHLDTGNTGFMILCTSLVMLMTPGLAFFYGGLVGRKNVLAIMMQSFVSMGWTTVIWYLYGYSLCFSGDWHGIIGNFNNVCLRGVGLNTPSPNNTIPALVFIAYQMMFAIITPALISGAFTNPLTFKAYMLFLTAWLTFVYFPFVHMVWGGGLLQQWGVRDFAGGIVVHNIAGIAALASVLYVGRRRVAIAGRTAFRWWRWAPGCCGLDGTASMPAARCALTPSPHPHSSTPILPHLSPR